MIHLLSLILLEKVLSILEVRFIQSFTSALRNADTLSLIKFLKSKLYVVET